MPGHEKRVPGWYLQQRRVQLVINHSAPAGPPRMDRLVIDRGLVPLTVLFYDEPLMAALARRPGVRLIPVSRLLPAAQAQVAAAPCERARGIFETLESFYFRWNQGRGADRQTLLAAVEARCNRP
jgi:hypothetical protein